MRASREQTPDEFRFAWKASKFITHWKRLTEKCKNSLELMETRLKVLGPKLGPVLFQLPPQFKANRERLASFLKLLNKRRQYAFEFRDASWYETADFGPVARAEYRLVPLRPPRRPFAVGSDRHARLYSRPRPERRIQGPVRENDYGGLDPFDQRLSRRKRLDVYCYFDNDQKSAAPKDARRLMEMTTRKKR